jgi:sugar phosphate isomerase/epimerase
MTAAGRSPVDYFKRYPNRYRMIHVKDFLALSQPVTSLDEAERPQGTELGKGSIDYRPIFTAAEAAGVEFYYVEQEPPFIGTTALEAATADYAYLHRLLNQ